MTRARFKAVELCDSEYLVQEEDGQVVAGFLLEALREQSNATLDMAGAKMLTMVFLRAVFARILNEFPGETLRDNLALHGLSPGDERRVKFVLDDLELRQKDPEAYDTARLKAYEMTT